MSAAPVRKSWVIELFNQSIQARMLPRLPRESMFSLSTRLQCVHVAVVEQQCEPGEQIFYSFVA